MKEMAEKIFDEEKVGMVPERIQLGDEYYIRASAIAASVQKLVMKKGETFLVCDKRGDLRASIYGEMGFYFEGTRFLNEAEVQINGQYPILLGSSITEDDSQILVDLTNADVEKKGRLLIPRDTIGLKRKLSIWDRHLFMEFVLENFSCDKVDFILDMSFGADFADVFEVRGMRRERRGKVFRPQWNGNRLTLSYFGLDKIRRSTHLTFEPQPHNIKQRQVRYNFSLNPKEKIPLSICLKVDIQGYPDPKVPPLEDIPVRCRKEASRWKRRGCAIFSNNELFNEWINRSIRDIYLLTTSTSWGNIPYAGIPWYVAPFGRDSIITALQSLPFIPHLAEDTIEFLAHFQGKKSDPFKDEEPGKIMHELRKGEMANLREIPFIPYYGSVDATPLFLILIHEYFLWTGNIKKIRRWWPNALNALNWMDNYGDMDGDGYVEYHTKSPKGLVNQGWKDSWDAISHKDGRLARSPLALVEVQGYVYAAKMGMAYLAEMLSQNDLAEKLRDEATQLKKRFNRDFWSEDLGIFALALDKEKIPCEVISSNPGHCLWTGIVDEEKANLMAQRLFEKDMFSGWGIRTLSEKEKRYNPMSYHNGSIWPHDNAIILSGLKRYGHLKLVDRLTTAFFDASLFFAHHQLPEVFCGFERTQQYGPTPYPVSCSPQAWASGAIFEIIKALLGLSACASKDHLYFNHPQLPAWLEWIEIRGLKVNGKVINFNINRGKYTSSIEILEKSKDLEVIVKR